MQAAGQLQEINCSGLAACCQHPPASSSSLSQTHSWAPRSLGVRGRQSSSHIVQEALLAAQRWGAGPTEQRWAGSQGLQVSLIPACCPTEEPLPGAPDAPGLQLFHPISTQPFARLPFVVSL